MLYVVCCMLCCNENGYVLLSELVSSFLWGIAASLPPLTHTYLLTSPPARRPKSPQRPDSLSLKTIPLGCLIYSSSSLAAYARPARQGSSASHARSRRVPGPRRAPHFPLVDASMHCTALQCAGLGPCSIAWVRLPLHPLPRTAPPT
jgi:hypothetical protein